MPKAQKIECPCGALLVLTKSFDELGLLVPYHEVGQTGLKCVYSRCPVKPSQFVH